MALISAKRYIIAIAISLSLYGYFPGIVKAQSGNFSVGCFNGLNDTDSPATIGDCQAQSSLNVEPNKGGTSVKKRKGFSREASLSVATSPVNGSHSFLADNGDRIDIVCHDVICAKSTNGGAYSNFIATNSAGITRWSFVSVDGDLYGANDQRMPVMKYTGTLLTHSTGIPQGTILELTNDRMVVSDTSANPNRVCYSASGAFENFVTDSADTGAWCDDLGAPGDRVTALKFNAGILHVSKSNSITACELGNQYTTKCDILASYVGTRDPASVITTPAGVMFKGNDGNFWSISSGNLLKLSREISTLVATQPQGSQRNNTTNSSTDWNATTHSITGYWDTTTNPGSIFPSSSTIADLSTGSFALGSTTGYTIVDDEILGGGVFTSPRSWQEWGGDMGFISAIQVMSSNFCPAGSVGISSMNFVAGGPCLESPSSTPDITVQIVKTSDMSVLYSNRHTSVAGTCGAENSIDFSTQAESIRIRLVDNYYGWKSTSPAFNPTFFPSGSIKYGIQSGPGFCSGGRARYSFFMVSPYFLASSTYTSRCMDTGTAEPVWGIPTLGITSSSVQGIDFNFSAATSCTGSFSALQKYVSAERVTAQNDRFIKYYANFNNTNHLTSSSMSLVGVNFASTGTYLSQCIQPGSAISAWGILSCAETLTGAADLTYYTRIGTTCATLSTGTWVAHTNNATIEVPTNPAFQFRFDSLLYSATEQAQVDACTIYWNEGSVAPPTWGMYDPVNDLAYWSIASGNVTANNRLLRYDLYLNSWNPWNVASTAPLIKDSAFYFGSASGGYWNKYGLTNSDNGSDIESYWKSKDWGAGSVFQEKAFDRASTVARNEQAGVVSVSYTDSQGNTGTYNISTATDSAKSYIRNNYFLPPLSPSTFLNIQYGNNSQYPWEINGYRLDYSILPWRALEQ